MLTATKPLSSEVTRSHPMWSFLAFVSCFFSLSALLLLVGAGPISVLAAPLGAIGGSVSLAKLPARQGTAGRGMAIVAIGIGTVAFVLALIVVLGTRAT